MENVIPYHISSLSHSLASLFVFKTTELNMTFCSVHARKMLKGRACGCLNKGCDCCGLSWLFFVCLVGFFCCLLSIFQWTQVKLQEQQGSMFKLHSGCLAPKAVEKSCWVPDLLCWVTREGLFQRTYRSIRGKSMFLIYVVLQLKKYLQSSIHIFQDQHLS